MRCLRLIALWALSSVVSAQSEAPFGAEDKIAIEKLYERYAKAFIGQDYEGIRDCIEEPFIVFARGQVTSFETADAVVSFFRRQRQALEQRGYLRAEILKSQLTLLSAERALIHKSYRRYKTDGSILEDGASLYPVSKTSRGWRLRGVIPQDFKHFGKTQ